MARRRSDDGLQDDFGQEDDGLGGLLGGGSLGTPVGPNEGGPGIGGVFEQLPNIKVPGTRPPDDPLGPLDPDESGPIGNTERPRDLAGPNATPNTFGLPEGVSVNDGMFSGVNDGMFSGVPKSGNAMNTPAQPRTPQLSSGNVMNAPPESGNSQGPMRRSASAPSIFGEKRGGQTMFGRADGLLGGGKGLVGAEESSGPIAPTEMMMRLLQMFRGQQ